MNLIERLRTGEDMPHDDDAAFRWYSQITDDAADKIEQLTKAIERLAEIVMDEYPSTDGRYIYAEKTMEEIK